MGWLGHPCPECHFAIGCRLGRPETACVGKEEGKGVGGGGVYIVYSSQDGRGRESSELKVKMESCIGRPYRRGEVRRGIDSEEMEVR